MRKNFFYPVMIRLVFVLTVLSIASESLAQSEVFPLTHGKIDFRGKVPAHLTVKVKKTDSYSKLPSDSLRLQPIQISSDTALVWIEEPYRLADEEVRGSWYYKITRDLTDEQCLLGIHSELEHYKLVCCEDPIAKINIAKMQATFSSDSTVVIVREIKVTPDHSEKDRFTCDLFVNIDSDSVVYSLRNFYTQGDTQLEVLNNRKHKKKLLKLKLVITLFIEEIEEILKESCK